jgi:hypothetical protein
LTNTNKPLRDQLIRIVSVLYPNRLGALMVGPVNVVLKTFIGVFLLPALPPQWMEKINFMSDPNKQLAKMLGGTAKVSIQRTFKGTFRAHPLVEKSDLQSTDVTVNPPPVPPIHRRDLESTAGPSNPPT